MRSVKHAHRPVRRYRSLLFPGISVLAILVFYAAFVSPGLRKGETARFEQDGLRLEITGVHRVGGFLGNCDPERKIFEPFDTYYVYPGAVLTVLEASSAEETVRWELRRGERGAGAGGWYGPSEAHRGLRSRTCMRSGYRTHIVVIPGHCRRSPL